MTQEVLPCGIVSEPSIKLGCGLAYLIKDVAFPQFTPFFTVRFRWRAAIYSDPLYHWAMPDYMPSVWTSIFKVQGVLYLLIPHLVKRVIAPYWFRNDSICRVRSAIVAQLLPSLIIVNTYGPLGPYTIAASWNRPSRKPTLSATCEPVPAGIPWR